MTYETYKKYRDKKGVSDYQVQQNTKVFCTALKRWEKGTAKPKMESQKKIATYLNIPMALVLEG